MPSRLKRDGIYLWLVGIAGFEPTTSWSQTRHSNRAELHPECGERGIRTLGTVTHTSV